MKKSLTYTSTIPADMMSMINHYAKELKIPKSKIIEIAVRNYLQVLKKNEYVESFKRAKNDAEITELAEAGFDDFVNIIK